MSKLNFVLPKEEEKKEETLPAFNRLDKVLGYEIDPWDYIGLEPGRWTQVPKSFAYAHLLNIPEKVTLRLPFQPKPVRKALTVVCNVETVTGYGVMTTNLVRELVKLRKDLTLYPISYWHYENTPEPVQVLMKRAWVKTEWAMVIAIPTELEALPKDTQIILYSMWETGKLPEGWGQICNQRVKHLIVPSEFQVNLWREGGYAGPIHVIPLGVDVETFVYRERPPRSSDVPFTILTYGAPLSSRKGAVETVVEVCWRAFASWGEQLPTVDNWKIILKSRAASPVGDFSDPHVQIIVRDDTPAQLADLCYRSDCGIFLSKFEGFGLPAREAMATGLPVILSENTGHLEDCDPAYNIPIPCVREVDSQDGYADPMREMKWYEPDWKFAAEVLRQEYENFIARGKTQSGLGRRAGLRMFATRQWRHSAEKLNMLLNEIVQSGG